MAALAHRSELRIIPYQTLLAAHPRFILASLAGDYLPRHLRKTGYQVEPIGTSVPAELYRVSAGASGVTFR
jgi:hypothetical protein